MTRAPDIIPESGPDPTQNRFSVPLDRADGITNITHVRYFSVLGIFSAVRLQMQSVADVVESTTPSDCGTTLKLYDTERKIFRTLLQY